MTQPDKMPAVFPNIGDPTAKATLIASNGPGFPTGIGAGKNGGIGDKDGPGGANGHCNPGDNCYGADGVDTEPSVLYKSDPEFSEEARKSKQQGIVVVCMWVTASGTATHIQPVQRLGFGLDESVVKSVATWRFKPATKAGKPVTVSDVCVNVDFRMY
jgi:TonB family protein